MAVNKVKEINNLDDFQEGVFKIERNGEIIAFTKEEMDAFRFFDTASKGRELLVKDQPDVVEEMTGEAVSEAWKNADKCFEIYKACENAVLTHDLYWDCFYKIAKVYRKYFIIDREFWYDKPMEHFL